MSTSDALPLLPDRPLGRPLRTVVLTCSDAGWESAAALKGGNGVELVAVVYTPPTKPKSLRTRLRNVYKYHGPAGVARIPLNELQALLTPPGRTASNNGKAASLPVLRFHNFHDDDCLATLRGLDIDLAVVDSTYILKPSIFLLPRFGSINLHCGRLPDYRGAPPAFWELYNGEPEVGVTVHRVTAKLDEGPILLQESFPLDVTPPGDPVEYVRDYWLRVLRPSGIRMLVRAAEQIVGGAATERAQGPSAHPTYRRPEFKMLQELRARVRQRRATAAAARG